MIARHFEVPVRQIAAALNYATVYPEEIEAAIADNEAMADLLHAILALDAQRGDEPWQGQIVFTRAR